MKIVLFVALSLLVSSNAFAQNGSKPEMSTASKGAAGAAAVPSSYRIGVEDILTVVFWKEKDLSAEVVVRPDGMISVPMLNDVPAVGLTPEELAGALAKAATKYVRDPGATVMVKEIRSRRVYVIGEVTNPGAFPVVNPLNVLQALAEAGGLLEHANKSNIVIVRQEGGSERRFNFNYKDVVRGRNTEQNIALIPGDTVLVR